MAAPPGRCFSRDYSLNGHHYIIAFRSDDGVNEHVEFRRIYVL